MDVRERAGSATFLLVTGDFGGNVPPALGLCRLLAERGHIVRVLAPRAFRGRIEAAGGMFRPFPSSLEWDVSNGRALEDQTDFWEEMTGGSALPEAMLAEIAAEPPDALVVDCMLDNAQWTAEASMIPSAVFVHSLVNIWTDLSYYERWAAFCVRADVTRSRLGLSPLDREPSLIPTWERLDSVVVTLPAELDAPTRLSSNLHYVGPVFEETAASAAWETPWPESDRRPLVVVSLGSTYMHHESELQRAIDAVAELDVRALVTTGFGLDPSEVTAPPHLHLTRYVSHAAALRQASTVLTHAGMGTVLAAAAVGVPLLCMPLGRDQPDVAERVEAIGAGRAVRKDASVEELRAGVETVLASDELRAGARRMAEVIAGYGAGALAVTELEGLLSLTH